jgi:GxxExxY protein
LLEGALGTRVRETSVHQHKAPASSSSLKMSSKETKYKHTELTSRVIGAFYEVYNELGHGFLEFVYRDAMAIVLTAGGLRVDREKPISVWFRGQIVGTFFADLIVEDSVIVEAKGIRALDAAHEAQLLNYLRATNVEVGLLLNFGPKPQVKRMLFNNERKRRAEGSPATPENAEEWPQMNTGEHRCS